MKLETCVNTLIATRCPAFESTNRALIHVRSVSRTKRISYHLSTLPFIALSIRIKEIMTTLMSSDVSKRLACNQSHGIDDLRMSLQEDISVMWGGHVVCPQWRCSLVIICYNIRECLCQDASDWENWTSVSTFLEWWRRFTFLSLHLKEGGEVMNQFPDIRLRSSTETVSVKWIRNTSALTRPLFDDFQRLQPDYA